MIPPVDFHGTVDVASGSRTGDWTMDGSFGWLRCALLARAAARVFAGKPLKRLGGPDDWIDGQDALSWCDVVGRGSEGPDERRNRGSNDWVACPLAT